MTRTWSGTNTRRENRSACYDNSSAVFKSVLSPNVDDLSYRENRRALVSLRQRQTTVELHELRISCLTAGPSPRNADALWVDFLESHGNSQGAFESRPDYRLNRLQ